MPVRSDLPPAVATLIDVGIGLVRRAPSARIAIARAGDIVELEALPAVLRDGAEREVAAARDATSEPLAPKDVEKVLRGAWRKPPAKVLDEFDPEPLAVRPAAQVHRGELDGAPVAIKVLKPGVERSVRNDLALLDAVAPPLRAAFPNLDVVAILRDLRELALDELDLEHEASQQRRVARALRGVDGITVPRPHTELAASDVLVSDLLDGATLADGAAPPDPAAAARVLVAAFRAAVLDGGLALVDPRPTHVLVASDGTLGLLGAGIARPVDPARAEQGLAALAALADDDADALADLATTAGLLPEPEARAAHPLLREVLNGLLDEPATLDAATLRGLSERALDNVGPLAGLALAASPQPQDLALGRMLGQLTALLARLERREDWVALAQGER